MTASNFESPIQNLEDFDILGVRNDGGIDAAIIAATPIDGSTDTLKLLTSKVRNYITELASQEFLTEHPMALGKTRIIIMAHGAIDVTVLGLIRSLSKEAQDAGIELTVEHFVT
jgi:hypothetical protein